MVGPRSGDTRGTELGCSRRQLSSGTLFTHRDLGSVPLLRGGSCVREEAGGDWHPRELCVLNSPQCRTWPSPSLHHPPCLPRCSTHPGAPRAWASRKGRLLGMTGPVSQAKQNPQIVQNLPLLPSPRDNTAFSPYSDFSGSTPSVIKPFRLLEEIVLPSFPPNPSLS